MPQNTPRGYTYPCFSDPADIQANLQDLAEDIDDDIQGILDDVEDARETPPSCIVTGNTPIALVAGVPVGPITFNAETYDNAAMFTPPGTTITVPVEGLYLIDFRCTFTGAVSGVKYAEIGVGGFVRCRVAYQRAGTAGQITVNGKILSFAAAGAGINMFVGSSTAATASLYSVMVTRMTGTTAL